MGLTSYGNWAGQKPQQAGLHVTNGTPWRAPDEGVSHKTIPHQFGIMTNKGVNYLRRKNLQITVPDNSPLHDQEWSLGARFSSSLIPSLLLREKPRVSGVSVSCQELWYGTERNMSLENIFAFLHIYHAFHWIYVCLYMSIWLIYDYIVL